MTPTGPEPIDPTVTPATAIPPESAADIAPAIEAMPEEEETSEQFMRRLVEENSWRMKPRPPRQVPPPEPKSIHLMTPEEMHDSLPVHLRRRRPDGSYYAMGLISRMQTDLAELTQGKRAATYPEVDEYLGYALLAEGLAPPTYTAEEASRWWRSGGNVALSEQSEEGNQNPTEETRRGVAVSIDDTPVEITDRPGVGAPDADPPPDGAVQRSPMPFDSVDFGGTPAEPQAQPAVAMRFSPRFGDSEDIITDGDTPWPSGGPAKGATLSRTSAPDGPDWEPFAAMSDAFAREMAERREKLAEALRDLPTATANAVANTMRGPQARALTPGEYKVVWEAFGGLIDLSDVKIVQGGGYNPFAQGAFRLGGNPAYTEGDTVYINPETKKGVPVYYSTDFSITPGGRNTLIHEFTHVLQYQRLGFGNFMTRYGNEEKNHGLSLNGFDRDVVYQYDKRNLSFDDETLEGQSQMAGDYTSLRLEKPTSPKRRAVERRLRGTGIYGL